MAHAKSDRYTAYLAAPLFTTEERLFNKTLADALQRYCNVFLPQEDGLLLTDLLKEGRMTQATAERMVFEEDRAAMLRCHLYVGVLNGAHIDEGVAAELGFCYALGKYCIGLQTDARRALISGNNPMINGFFNTIHSSIESLITEIAGMCNDG